MYLHCDSCASIAFRKSHLGLASIMAKVPPSFIQAVLAKSHVCPIWLTLKQNFRNGTYEYPFVLHLSEDKNIGLYRLYLSCICSKGPVSIRPFSWLKPIFFKLCVL